jgi:hypothetical protein
MCDFSIDKSTNTLTFRQATLKKTQLETAQGMRNHNRVETQMLRSLS